MDTAAGPSPSKTLSSSSSQSSSKRWRFFPRTIDALIFSSFAGILSSRASFAALHEATLPRPNIEPLPSPAQLAKRLPRAFLSYASEDREAVKESAEKLKARGVQPWRDEEELRAGEDWDKKLFAVIRTRRSIT